MDEFRSILLSLHGEILNEDLATIKFMYRGHIGDATLEKIKSSLELFKELEKRNKLGPENRSFLAGILGKIGREDLKNKLLGLPGKSYDDKYHSWPMTWVIFIIKIKKAKIN